MFRNEWSKEKVYFAFRRLREYAKDYADYILLEIVNLV
jgi:hypothetical protein